MNAVIKPDDLVINECIKALNATMMETKGIVFALVATVDGFEIASQAASGWSIQANRIAAMASSGHALGDTMAKELTAKKCKNVIIDADNLNIVFLEIPNFNHPPLILGIVATKTDSLGTILFGANQCAQRIGRLA